MEDLAYIYYVLNEEVDRALVESERTRYPIPAEHPPATPPARRPIEVDEDCDRLTQYYPSYPTLYL